jgi:hypothetical protein
MSLGIFAFLIFGIFYYANFSASSSIFSSPLPHEFSKVFYQPQMKSAYWMPNLKLHVKSNAKKPEITARGEEKIELDAEKFA